MKINAKFDFRNRNKKAIAVTLAGVIALAAIPVNAFAAPTYATKAVAGATGAVDQATGLAITNNGFKTVDSKYMAGYDSNVILMEHVKSGAQLVYIQNDDPSKAFSIGFKTVPVDDTGANHIFEHAVLNGSKNFPSKDMFNYMQSNTMSSDLNAMTMPDLTMYPFSTKNENDYNNLMRVYLDAVFYPNVITDKRLMQQEGWRYELDSEGNLIYNGTVYNEIKGSSSNVYEYIVYDTMEELFPGTQYQYNSGGTIEGIPELSHEELVAVYEKNYQPSNSLIYLYGDQDINNTLKIINEEYLSNFENTKAEVDIPTPKPLTEPKDVKRTYPVSASETDAKTFFTVNYALCDRGDLKEVAKLRFLNTAMSQLENSPLSTALNDLGICESVEFYFSEDLGTTYLSIIFVGIDPKDKDLALTAVDKVMADIAKGGFDPALIEMAAQAYEFDNVAKAIDSQTELIRDEAYSQYMYGENLMDFTNMPKYMEEVIKNASADSNYFNKDVEKYFVNNKNKAIILFEPEIGGIERGEAEIRAELDAYEASLSKAEKDAMLKDMSDFKVWQQAPVPAEVTAKMPKLTVNDISNATEAVDYKNEVVNGVAYNYTNVFTNGMSAMKFTFKTSALPQDKIQYAELYADLMNDAVANNNNASVDMNSKGASAGTLAASNGQHINSHDGNKYTPVFTLNCNVLDKDMDDSLAFTTQVINGFTVTDKEAVREFLINKKSEMEMSMQDSFAPTAVAGNLLESDKYISQTSGYAYYNFICTTLDNLDKDWVNISKNINSVKEYVFTKDNVVLGFAGSPEQYAKFKTSTVGLVNSLSTKKTTPQTYIFSDASNKVAFPSGTSTNQSVVQGGVFMGTEYKYSGAMEIVNSIVQNEYLIPNVRDVGGAYSAYCYIDDGGSVILASGQDPNIGATLEVFDGIPEYLRTTEFTADQINGVIINSVAALDEATVGSNAWDYANDVYFGSTDPKQTAQTRNEMLNTKPEDMKDFAPLYEEILKQDIYSVSGSATNIQKEAALFDEIIK